MRIKDVLDLKGHRIETVWPWRSVGDIPRLFVDRNIASVVVIEVADRPIGIVTDRLLLRALAERGTEVLKPHGEGHHAIAATVVRSDG